MTEDKTYYVIGNYIGRDGLFAIYKHVVSHVIYAIENGWIPVVDLKNFQNQYFKDHRQHKDNVWEYYFEQPANIKLEDIENSDNIKLAPKSIWAKKKYSIYPNQLPCAKIDIKLPYTEEYFKFLKYTPEMTNYMEECYTKLFEGQTDVLGVICRGSDYTIKRPKGHQIQPNPNIVLKEAKKLIKSGKYKKVYLATEDANIYNLFKKEFGSILIENIQYKYKTTNRKYISETKSPRENHFYNLGKEYLCSMYLLTKCKALIGGRTNGTLAVYIMTNGFANYDYVYLWNIGAYGTDDIMTVKNFINYTFKNWHKKIFDISNSYVNGKKCKFLTILGKRIFLKYKN